MTSAPGLAFANLTLMLDLPQLPAIFFVNVRNNFQVLMNEIKLNTVENEEIFYPHNRINLQNGKINKMGRTRKYSNNRNWLFGTPF
ncbi:conserved Plasmodium protein, unknown function [Plasmodium knowlesi strain H]|uniref:Uncharacterized protein n=3 Tax=Plasmodium knowlesi TaxID=5850 RepID=A0A5K1TUJ3_PLAKH|nr:uncharacterized protein PKNH_0836100 [Plasmodium knowlesi strain H]OTN65966.1 Uncharacterized protein PKNOH_S100064700 [Plasmodium knowlesi]CAA9987999.1 ATP synthase-associated protein, putative [Plasmodium knowlesi strain H]SBO22060.1 conserved Plasmodium protein, unknown function [Plasmodium knowlesi strain H]SBO29144.1 conserved Plasmodium protein, unknown function [Plasmodium knowlesi strain H]VVS77473.1 ATP synthase-associated protein, putative [Plasmodium knowlesi strain H]|eukprot:XP_002258978.1 [Plasmodium knowlesi strain H]